MKKMKMNIQNDITFEEGVELYYLDCKARNLADGTLKHYKDSVKQIFKYIEPDTLIEDMTLDLFNEFVIELRENPCLNDMSMSTYARDLKTLMYFFMHKEFIPKFKIKIPKVSTTPIETYSDTDLTKLLKKPNLKQCGFTEYKMWVITNFLLSTGVRQKSLLNIKIKDLDFDADVLTVTHTKNRKALIIPLNSDIKKILQEYLKYRKGEDEDYLFCNIYGKKLAKSTLTHTILEYNRKRNVNKAGSHRYRHTFAKKWVTLGGNIVTLQKILGHSSLAITQHYINLLVSDLKKDVEEFNILREFKHEAIKMK